MSEANFTGRRLRVFLCHGSEDKPIVREIYTRLREDGVEPWLDTQDLLPGQDWNAEIKRAVRRSDAILVCLSSKSVRKEGYVQKEIRFALDAADEKPEGTIFIIPLKLDECKLPERLQPWQWVEWWSTDAYQRILRSLRARADECGVAHVPGERRLLSLRPPVEDVSGRTLYKTADVQELIRKNYDGELFAEDVSILPVEQVVAVTDEAFNDLLNRFQSDERRAEEKEKLLTLIGIRSPYREWQEATTKHHCFRNEFDSAENGDQMERISVVSSNLASVGYHPRSRTLEVAFRSGAIYEYYDILEYLYQGLLNAPSHGKFLDAYIKKAGFAYRQIR